MTPKDEWKLVKRSAEAPSGHLVVLGINYHSSPIAIRERFIIPDYCLAHALHALTRFPHVKEAAVLSTCNRTEVYAVVSDVQSGLSEIESFFLHTQGIQDHNALKPNFRLLRDDVALHLFRVASGLDSMVLGEGQIMSQVKGALRAAQEAGASGPVLDQIFQLSLNCGKRVRTETDMARRAVSVSSAAVELAREIVGPLAERSVTVIGGGKMAKICTKHLLSEGGDGAIVMVNRTQERVGEFAQSKLPHAEKLKTTFSFAERHHLAAASDVVIVSTGAPEFVLNLDEFKAIHHGKEVCVVDISVPRNVDPEIGKLPGVNLYHTDHLSAIVNRNMAEREALVSQAEGLVFDTLSEFHAWQRSLLVVPTITGLRKKIESIRQEQIQKTTKMCTGPVDDMAQAEQISRAIVNRILHHPTVQLKATIDQDLLRRQAEVLQTLFEIDVFDRELQ